jgi:hypothetical protein
MSGLYNIAHVAIRLVLCFLLVPDVMEHFSPITNTLLLQIYPDYYELLHHL